MVTPLGMDNVGCKIIGAETILDTQSLFKRINNRYERKYDYVGNLINIEFINGKRKKKNWIYKVKIKHTSDPQVKPFPFLPAHKTTNERRVISHYKQKVLPHIKTKHRR